MPMTFNKVWQEGFIFKLKSIEIPMCYTNVLLDLK